MNTSPQKLRRPSSESTTLQSQGVRSTTRAISLRLATPPSSRLALPRGATQPRPPVQRARPRQTKHPQDRPPRRFLLRLRRHPCASSPASQATRQVQLQLQARVRPDPLLRIKRLKNLGRRRLLASRRCRQGAGHRATSTNLHPSPRASFRRAGSVKVALVMVCPLHPRPSPSAVRTRWNAAPVSSPPVSRASSPKPRFQRRQAKRPAGRLGLVSAGPRRTIPLPLRLTSRTLRLRKLQRLQDLRLINRLLQ